MRTKGDHARGGSDQAAGAQEGSPLFPSGSCFHCHSGASSRAQRRPFPSQPRLMHQGLGSASDLATSTPRAAKPQTLKLADPCCNPRAPFLCSCVPAQAASGELESHPIAARAAEASGSCSSGSPSASALPGSARSVAIVLRADAFCFGAPRPFGS